MFALLRIALRNLLRAKRRNTLSGGTMALGSAALVLGNGLADGIARQLTDNLVAIQSGHVQVVVRPSDFQPQNSPFDVYGIDPLPKAEAIAARIEERGREKGVVSAVPYLNGRGSAISGNRSSLATIIGIHPEREPALRAALRPQAGAFLPEADDSAVYVAAPVARKLRLGVGDSVSFVVQTPQGAVNSLDAIVCGVFAKSAPWFDNTFYISLAAAQSLFGFDDAATNVKVLLVAGSPATARRAKPIVEQAVAEIAPVPPVKKTHVQVESYDKAGRFYFSIIQANAAALVVLSSFLFLAAAVGIVNSMLMSVHERTREIGTIRALGMRRGAVIRLFVLEGLALGIVAAVLGVVLGGVLVSYWGAHGIRMNTMTLAWLAGGDYLYPLLRAASALRAFLAIALISTFAAVYPAYAASRLEPREALHHV